MKTLLTLSLLVIMDSAVSQESRMCNNRLGFSAGNVSGVGLSYQRELFGNLSAMFLVGGVAQKSHGDFNTGMSLKYTFSRINRNLRVYFVASGSYFFDRDIDGIYDVETQTYTDRERRYVKMGGGLGLEALYFDGRLGVDVNFIGAGASFQKRQDARKYTFGDKPILGPQISLNYNF
jgi:hypothetical protein